MGFTGSEVVIVSDIGCSGLFDTFFRTHAFHGLHGRALTYAAGIKLAQPDLKVIVTMGDGGLGIGGAHFLAACRRNLNLCLLVLNNFNFGMTGGQFSCTTPEQASVASTFLNILEKPFDVCNVAACAGAPFVARSSVYRKNLPKLLAEAISFEGFAVVDLWGGCPARYTKKNPLSPKEIESAIEKLPPYQGVVSTNMRREYSSHYRQEAAKDRGGVDWHGSEKTFEPTVKERREVVFLGSAGQRVITGGGLLGRAAILAGLNVTQKNDYHITVMRGPSVTEVIVSPQAITYTEVEKPDVIVALSEEGVRKRWGLFERIEKGGRVILAAGVEIPATDAQVKEVDFKAGGIKKKERTLAALALLAKSGDPVTLEMLDEALEQSFQGKRLEEARKVLKKAAEIPFHARTQSK
jgi:pyruvate/2-oxoacid:ferredoxin oxidoreductase beta subunit/Pyruvate/2-oxoacid:ferredoxin oxidoreductase gamma subunit